MRTQRPRRKIRRGRGCGRASAEGRGARASAAVPTRKGGRARGRSGAGVDARPGGDERRGMRLRLLPAVGAALTCTLVACSDARGPVTPPLTTREVVATGRVHMLDGSAPAGVVARIGAASAPIAANGTFTVQAMVTTDSVDLIIDVPPGAARTTLPALLRLPSTTAAGITVVLVPNRWTVTGGAYHGTTVNVSLDAAFRPPCSTAGDTNCDGFFPAAWFSGIKLWPAAAYPIRVAFDHPRSHLVVTAADSAAFWTIVDRMNADLGTAAFRPARIDELSLTDGRPLDAVVVRVDTTLASFSAWTNWWWNGAGEMYAGVIRTARADHVRSGWLMTHELLHTQGLKHSCSWSTVMGGYGCSPAARLSATDVAYTQLARHVRDAQRAAGPGAHGLIAALQGERVVIAGLPPFATGRALRFGTLGGDSIGHGDHAH
jgi:hypothetical protein